MKFFIFIFLFLIIRTSNAQVIAPDFTLTDINGITRTLYTELDLGKPVILDFYSATCGSCISNIPILENYWQTYGNNGDSLWIWGVEINGITDSSLIAFHNQYPSTFPNFSTYSDDSVISLYNITYSPQYWVVCPSHAMKFVSISNIDQAIKGCSNSNSVQVLHESSKLNWYYFESNKLKILGNELNFPGKLIVYNLIGNKIIEQELYDTNQNIHLDINSGAYVISFLSNNGIMLIGKILKY